MITAIIGILIISTLFTIAYLFDTSSDESHSDIVYRNRKLTKLIVPFIMFLSYFLLSVMNPSMTYVLIMAGMFFALIGDMVFAFDGKLPYGLMSFATAYSIYAYTFFSKLSSDISENAMIWPTIAITLATSLFVFIKCKANEREFPMNIGIPFYLTVLCAMNIGASATHSITLVVGTALFFLSDIFITWDLYIRKLGKHRDSLVFSTYTIAHTLMAISLIMIPH